jgi:hypothetical protein
MAYRGDTDHQFGGDPENRVTIRAFPLDGGGFQIVGNESLMYDETYWTYVIAPEHVGELRAAVNARDDQNLAEVIERCLYGGTIPGLPWKLGSWLADNGVQYVVTEKHWKS